jgi:hypothetical protein
LLKAIRSGTRFEKDVGWYDGFVHPACAFVAPNRLVR